MSAWTEKFKDPEWQKLRLRIMERDKWECVNCHHSNGKMLNVHHLFYNDDFEFPWEYPDNLLVTLCEECHGEAHDHPVFIPGEFKDALEIGILSLSSIEDVWNREMDYACHTLNANWGPLV
jgi:hypothetical protein